MKTQIDKEKTGRVQGCFLGGIYCVGSDSALLAHLKRLKTSCSVSFLVKIAEFWWILQFFIKTAFAERILKPVTMKVGAGDSIEGCDLKMAPKTMHFSCPLLDVVCVSNSELAHVDTVVGFKLA